MDWVSKKSCLLFFAMSCSFGAFASDSEVNFDNRLSVYYGKWIESRLPAFPKNLVTGNLDPKSAYINSIIYSRNLKKIDASVPYANIDFPLNIEAEFTLSKHGGYQNHTEATAGLMLRALGPTLGRWGRMSVGWSNGFSYAFQNPKYEKGESGRIGDRTKKFQYYMGFEVGFTPAVAKNFEVFMRLHHRSGVYGLISKSKTGSNYLGMGVRYSF